MNHPVEVKPGDGPLTVYVVAVLFVRRVAPDGRFGTGYGAEEVLLQHQFSRPGVNPLAAGDAIECGIQHIRKGWSEVMPAHSDAAHYGASRANVNATVIRPALDSPRRVKRRAETTTVSQASGDPQ